MKTFSMSVLHLVSKTIRNNIRTTQQFKSLTSHATASQTTVDNEEVDHHAKQMEEWWKPDGSMKALHSFNLIRVPFVRDGLQCEKLEERSITPLRNLKILDVGCGGGILSEPLARLGATVTGLDASPDLINCAQVHSSQNSHIRNNPPTYICSTIEEHAEKNENYYDGVVASEIIEHVTNKELFIKSCIRTLKPSGRIFFTTPNRSRLSHFFTIFIAENFFNVVPRGTHEIDKFTTPTELTFLVERNDCHVETIYGSFYNVLTNKWSWTKNQSLMFALQAVKN